MNEKATSASGDGDDVKKAVVQYLRSRSKKARFISELSASLRRSGVNVKEVERVLSELEAERLVMIRDHFCADPHLAGVDLRVVAIVDSAADADPELRAIREIDEAWNKWLAAYLANHRCS
jgi:hypothetical protein